MKSKVKNEGVLSNLSWKFAERITAQVVTMVVSIILARILEPAHYGTISIVMIFITIANVFVSDGIGSSLVQKKNADKLDFSTMLIFNVAFSSLLYLIVFVCAPMVSDFYGEEYEILTPVLRVLGLRIILTGINSIQHAYISKKLLFRRFFWSTLTGTILSAMVGIVLAYKGFGVWALVFQYLTNTTVDTIFLAFTIGKKPILMFSIQRLKELLGFGIKILCTNLLGTGYNQLRALIIGKIYTPSDLAYFDKGQQFPSLIVTNINSSISAVLFPRMAIDQDDRRKVKNLVRKAIRFSSFALCPMMLGFAAVAKQFVIVVLTEKWLPCVELLQLLCVYYLFWPIHSANMQAIKALGEGKVYFYLEVVKKIIEVIILLLTFRISVFAMTLGMAASSLLFVAINAYPNKRLINYSLSEQLKDILPNVFRSALMAGAVYLIGHFLSIGPFYLLIIQVASGIIIYFILSIMSDNSECKAILKIMKKHIQFNRNH